MATDNRGQIGPMSLEDIFPMVIAFMMTFILIASVYTITGGQLEQRSAESSQDIARETALLLETKSMLVYGNQKALLDVYQINTETYEDLNETYAITGYYFSTDIEDLVTGEKWSYKPGKMGLNTASTAFPVAIRYAEDTIHEGLLSVRVWRK